MAANIFILIFLVLITWLLYRYRLITLTDLAGTRNEFAALGIIVLFFVANAVFALAGYLSLRTAASVEPVRYASVIEETPSGQFVVISGTVSRSNKVVYADYVAYQDDMHLWVPSGIIIDLQRGTALVSNDNFAARGWPVDASDYTYLKPGQIVTVVGQVERSKGILGADKGKEFVSIRADVVFAGTSAQFASSASWKSAVALAFVVADLAGAVVVLIIGLVLFVRLKIRKQQPSA